MRTILNAFFLVAFLIGYVGLAITLVCAVIFFLLMGGQVLLLAWEPLLKMVLAFVLIVLCVALLTD